MRFANAGKFGRYAEFLREYRRVAKVCLDVLWDEGWLSGSKGRIRLFDPESDSLDCPKGMNREINDAIGETTLSARALKCCSDQVCGIAKSATEKRRRLLWLVSKLRSEGKPTAKVERKLRSVTKPNVSRINAELNSICCDFRKGTSFDGFLQLKCLGEAFGRIRIPVKLHRGSAKWESGRMMASFLLANGYVAVRWEREAPPPRETGVSVGADQGKNKVLALGEAVSEDAAMRGRESFTERTDIHGHSLDSIMDRLSRRRKGSKAFRRSQEHRKNFINWSINSLNLDGIREVRLEGIGNIAYGKRTSRKMSHWTNTLIRDKLLSTCESLGVQAIQQDPAYRSQRCSRCGQVRKANRKGEAYACANCGLEIDADLNAARNHAQDLPKIPEALRRLRRNFGKGFLWKPDGFFTMAGEEFTVPLSKKEHLT